MSDSPIKIERRGQKLEVVHRDSGGVLAWCYIGDEVNTERIADILSAKGLRREAMEFRQLVADDRRPLKAVLGSGKIATTATQMLEMIFGK